MQLRVGCRFDHDTVGETPAVIMVEPHPEQPAGLVREAWTTEPPLPASSYTDLYGNRLRRLTLPDGASHLSYDAVLEIPPEPEQMPGPDDVQHRIEALPDEVLHWLLPSRLCQSDELADTAWRAVRVDPAGRRARAGRLRLGQRQRRVRRRQHSRRRRSSTSSSGAAACAATSPTSASRSAARSASPPATRSATCPTSASRARYPPMDFHAWFEVWLGDRWWTYDARFNTPRIGRVPIGRGRDAVDVAMVTTFGAATLRRMTVWADEVVAEAAAGG